MKRSPLIDALLHVPLILGALVCLVPFAWLICATMKSRERTRTICPTHAPA